MSTQQPQKVKLTVSQILEDLNNGLDRKAIREKYNLTATDVSRLFQHEKLKGVRVRTAPAFELEDDTAEAAAPAASPKKKKVAPSAAMTEAAPATATVNQEEVKEAAEEAAEDVKEEAPTPSGEIKEVPGTEEGTTVTPGLW